MLKWLFRRRDPRRCAIACANRSGACTWISSATSCAVDEAYVELATSVAGEPEGRQALRRRIESGRPALFGDPAPLDALERFIESVVA
jgi:hypothetical protein